MYISLYGSSNTSNTAQNAIMQEYNTTIAAAGVIVNSIQGYAQQIQNLQQPISSSLAGVQGNLTNLNNTLSNFSNNVINTLINVQGQIKSNGLTVFYVFFALILGLNVLNILGIIFFGLCDKQFFRCFNHISWIFNAIFMIITFILGSAFCIFGVFGQDSSSTFMYLFGNDSLTTGVLFDNNNGVGNMINICINGNGDIADNYFNLTTGSTNNLALLYNASFALNQTQSNLTAHSTSIVIPFINGQYQNYSYDITQVNLASELNTYNQPSSVLQAWRGWSDSNQGLQMSKCNAPAQDEFFQNKSMCPSAYPYYPTSSGTTGSLNTKDCLQVLDWSNTQVTQRYTSFSNCQGNSDFTSVLSANQAYLGNVTNFINANTLLLNNLIKDNNNYLSGNFSATMAKMQYLVNVTMSNITNPLTNILINYIGQSSFYNIINCKFIGIDISSIVNVFGGSFSTSSLGLGIMIIVISFCNAIAVIFTIFMINFNIPAEDAPAGEPKPQEVEMAVK